MDRVPAAADGSKKNFFEKYVLNWMLKIVATCIREVPFARNICFNYHNNCFIFSRSKGPNISKVSYIHAKKIYGCIMEDCISTSYID